MAKFLTLRVWILIIFLFLALLAINPNPVAKGIEIKSVKQGSLAAEFGLKPNYVIKAVNDKPVETLLDYRNAVEELMNEPQIVTIKTDKGKFSYNATNDIGFNADNLTIISSEEFTKLEADMIVEEINGEKVEDDKELEKIVDELIPKKKVSVVTNKGTFVYLTRGPPELTVREVRKSNIDLGLDLEGGSRVLLQPISDEEITDDTLSKLILVMGNRLDVYGLSDLKIRPANDLEGNKFVLIEIAGATREEVQELIAKQGRFEAKIKDEIVFEGGEKDIPYVCMGDGSCSGVRDCNMVGDTWYCKFEFAIKLSPNAAKKHALVTEKLGIVANEEGREMLNETLDLYLDKRKMDSLQISAELKGKETMDIAISGPGTGPTKNAAIENALKNMEKLQTILITGSLPLDIKIVKLDSISPIFGEEFIKNILFVGFLAVLAVAFVIFIRYRQPKIIILNIAILLSEIFITLGVAAFIQWNLDLAAIAGLIIAVGTGVNDQVVIIDEVLKGTTERFFSWKQKIKRAFFIIIAAYVTIVAAMIPLWFAGAGLIRGFAVTTIIGVTIGILITRPAFSSMAEKVLNK